MTKILRGFTEFFYKWDLMVWDRQLCQKAKCNANRQSCLQGKQTVVRGSGSFIETTVTPKEHGP